MKTLSCYMPLVATLAVLGACSIRPEASSPTALASGEPPSGSDRLAAPVLIDVSSAGIDLADDIVLPARAATHTAVPWDSMAMLEVSNGTEHEELRAGALIVRYGKSGAIEDGLVATIYLLEPAGATIEPIALRWQPKSGSELRAIARVNGVLRCYDFDR